MEFLPFKPKQISDSQWRYYQHKGAADLGLALFDVDDDMVEEVLHERAAKYAKDPSGASETEKPKKAKAKAKTSDVEPAKVADGSVLEKANSIENWNEFRSFARDYIGSPLPRSRADILEALRELN
jgi:predicted kinase